MGKLKPGGEEGSTFMGVNLINPKKFCHDPLRGEKGKRRGKF